MWCLGEVKHIYCSSVLQETAAHGAPSRWGQRVTRGLLWGKATANCDLHCSPHNVAEELRQSHPQKAERGEKTPTEIPH